MRFKTWLESIEIKKPHDKVKRVNVIKDKDTNVARKIITYVWTTSHGNEINLQFEPKGNDEYSIIFYVNNVLYDYGSKLGIANKGINRDSEVLSNVFYVLKQKADKLNAKMLTFRAHKSENDTKIIKNIDIEPYKKASLIAIDEFVNQIISHEIKEVQPSQSKINIYTKLGKEIPKQYDIDKERWLKWANEVKHNIENNIPIYDLIGNLKTAELSFPYKLNALIANLENINKAILSNTKEGYARTRNRRTNIYKRIIDKYFINWDINVNGDNFTLIKKSIT